MQATILGNDTAPTQDHTAQGGADHSPQAGLSDNAGEAKRGAGAMGKTMTDDVDTGERLKTGNLSLASYLVARGQKVLAIESEERTRYKRFVFDGRAEPIMEEFFVDQPIAPRLLLRAWRDVKAMLRG